MNEQPDLFTAPPALANEVPYLGPTEQLEAEMWLVARLALHVLPGDDPKPRRAYVGAFFAGTSTTAHRARRMQEALVGANVELVLCGAFKDTKALTYSQAFRKIYSLALKPTRGEKHAES